MALLLVMLSAAAQQVLGQGQMTAAQIVAQLNTLTTQTSDLQRVAGSLSSGVVGEVIAFPNPQNVNSLVAGFTGIINTAQNYISQGGPATLTGTEAQEVAAAYTTFVQMSQNLLKTVIGQAGLLQDLFAPQVAAVLRSYEGVIDTYGFGIIDAFPSSVAAAATIEKDSLDATVKQAICAYTPGGSLGLDFLCS